MREQKTHIKKIYFKRSKTIILYVMFLFYSSQIFSQNIFTNNTSKKEFLTEPIKTYRGWWIFGEGQHIFKNEASLEEYNLKFKNENSNALNKLYLEVCQMEYFPMECEMRGYFDKKVLGKVKTFIVLDFDILYVEGCGE